MLSLNVRTNWKELSQWPDLQHLRLEQAIQFYKMLERDRRLTETELTKVFPGKRLTGKLMPLHNQAIRMPANPTRVDRLIWDNFREHARITDLARKMEKHSGISKQVWPLYLIIHFFFPVFLVKCFTSKLICEGQMNCRSTESSSHFFPPAQMTPFGVTWPDSRSPLALKKQREESVNTCF